MIHFSDAWSNVHIIEPHKYLRSTTKETIMQTFKQFLQNKAANKRAELADVEAQAKSVEADEQRKKAATRPMSKSSKLNTTVPF
jgi:cbb3-type cytochrome oxidase cytochrome c subunit